MKSLGAADVASSPVNSCTNGESGIDRQNKSFTASYVCGMVGIDINGAKVTATSTGANRRHMNCSGANSMVLGSTHLGTGEKWYWVNIPALPLYLVNPGAVQTLSLRRTNLFWSQNGLGEFYRSSWEELQRKKFNLFSFLERSQSPWACLRLLWD